MDSGNGRRPPSYKDAQKNVSVYIGKKGGSEHELLQLMSEVLGKSESQIFRECYIEKMVKWGVLDPDTKKPIDDAIDTLKRKISNDLLPDVLDRT